MRRIICLLLCLCCLLPMTALPVLAEEIGNVNIRNEEEFLAFAEACARESFSLGRSFTLLADLDLNGEEYHPAPYFAGTFNGQGHTIRGVNISEDGSRQGLFRWIAAEGTVQNLQVQGTVSPGGSREFIGGICGVNDGRIQDCVFQGEVAGIGNVGGIVGRNSVSGMVSTCQFSGEVRGEHQTGGIVGLNEGRILRCGNLGNVNTVLITPESEPHFDLASFSQEDFVDLSNTGGIAGENAGLLQSCRNQGNVGYRYTGYNVGGVVGKSKGFVDDCTNEGTVEGRRDTGGIVGQSIPYAAWEFSSEELDELRDAISYMHYLLNMANYHVEEGRDDVVLYLLQMSNYTDSAMEALRTLILGEGGTPWDGMLVIDPETEEITLPSWSWDFGDTGDLSEALVGMRGQTELLVNSMGASVCTLAEDVKNISHQMGYIFNLIFAAVNVNTDDLVTQKDLSLSEAYEHDEGAVARCYNRGSVRAETNAGGIVGTIGFEVSFDMEDTLNASGYLGTHAEQSLFAVIRRCDNRGDIFTRSDNAGGIIGRMDMGAVLDCVSRGRMESQTGDFVGGIGGSCQGTLIRCLSRCDLAGRRYLGGIAGQGEDLQNCGSWTHISRGSEYLGAVAGWADGEIRDNIYVETSPEGIDGISRIGQTKPVSVSTLLAESGVPEDFNTVTIRFVAEDRTVQIRQLPFGSAVTQLPEVPSKGNNTWHWDDPGNDGVYSDIVISGSYSGPASTISTGEAVAQFLVEGEFYEDQILSVTPFDPKEKNENFLGAYRLTVSNYEGMLLIRMRSDSAVKLYRTDESGEWEELPFEADGQYLLFEAPNGSGILCEQYKSFDWRLPVIGGAVLLELLLMLTRKAVRHQKRKRMT